MKRFLPLVVAVLALGAFAPAVAADTAPVPRESFEAVGFDAFNSECDARTCTDTNIFADQQTTGSGEVFGFVCVDQFTYNIRTGRGSGIGGCADLPNVTVAGDLSSATLAPTDIEMCSRRHCETITVTAELSGTGGTSTFRVRSTERDGTCTFTFTENSSRRAASGTVTIDGATTAVDGSIRESQTTVTSKCR